MKAGNQGSDPDRIAQCQCIQKGSILCRPLIRIVFMYLLCPHWISTTRIVSRHPNPADTCSTPPGQQQCNKYFDQWHHVIKISQD